MIDGLQTASAAGQKDTRKIFANKWPGLSWETKIVDYLSRTIHNFYHQKTEKDRQNSYGVCVRNKLAKLFESQKSLSYTTLLKEIIQKYEPTSCKDVSFLLMKNLIQNDKSVGSQTSRNLYGKGSWTTKITGYRKSSKLFEVCVAIRLEELYGSDNLQPTKNELEVKLNEKTTDGRFKLGKKRQ